MFKKLNQNNEELKEYLLGGKAEITFDEGQIKFLILDSKELNKNTVYIFLYGMMAVESYLFVIKDAFISRSELPHAISQVELKSNQLQIWHMSQNINDKIPCFAVTGETFTLYQLLNFDLENSTLSEAVKLITEVNYE